MERNDDNLIKEYLDGDEKSFEILVQQYLKLIYNFVYRKINNVAEAEDITQEIFLKVWRNIKKFDQDKKFKSWIFTIAKNTAIDWLRKKKSLPFSAFDDEHGNNSLINKLIGKNNIIENNLAYALEELSPDYQKIISMHHDHAFSFKEIAETIGESINTTKSRYRRAIVKLKQIIK
ncbi:MAG: RNA polymerase sigma factor [Patescibacteria group bacterium]